MTVAVDVITGAAFGSEGKGLAAEMIGRRYKHDLIVSVNSSQAGHTSPVFENDSLLGYMVTRQLPAAALGNRTAKVFLAPGSVIRAHVLFEEIEQIENQFKVPIRNRLYVSAFASVITDEDIRYEEEEKMWEKGGSTQEGVGRAVSLRAIRKGAIVRDVRDEFARHGVQVIDEVDPLELISTHYTLGSIRSGNVLLEGSQGFGLSTFYKFYPYCTSRPATTAGFLAMANLSPKLVRNVYGVTRTFPIRVAGNSGPLHEELDWATLSKEAGYDDLTEITTVTKRIRRIGRFDMDLYKSALEINGITHPILTFANYLGKENEGVTTWEGLTDNAKKFIQNVEAVSGIGFWAISTAKSGGWILS